MQRSMRLKLQLFLYPVIFSFLQGLPLAHAHHEEKKPERSSPCERAGSYFTPEILKHPIATEHTSNSYVSLVYSNQIPMSVPALIEAYGLGIFPWDISPISGNPHWSDLEPRGVLRFSDMDIDWSGQTPRIRSRRLRQIYEGALEKYEVTFDVAFRKVMEKCRNQVRGDFESPEIPKTWISDQHLYFYNELHNMGLAHSVEVWRKDTKLLVGGLYGVMINGYFSGESMFFEKESEGGAESEAKGKDASKLAILSLIFHLKKQGLEWIDTQLLINGSFFERLNAKRISRAEFQELLLKARENPLSFPKDP